MKWVKDSVYEFLADEIKFRNDKITRIDKIFDKKH